MIAYRQSSETYVCQFMGAVVTAPLRYQVLDYIRDPQQGRAVSNANQKHLIATLSNDPLLVELRGYLDGSQSVDESDLENRFIDRLSRPKWIEGLLDNIASPDFDVLELVPQLRAYEDNYFNVLEIFWHSKISIFLSIVDARKAEMFSAPDPNFNVMGFTTYLCFLKGGPATIRVFDVEGRHPTTQDREVRAGDMIPVRGGRNSMKFLSCKSDLAVLAINVLTTESHDVLRYSAADGKIVKRSTNDAEAQRFFLYSTVLRKMERSDAVNVLVRLLEHNEPTLRWHVMRELLAIDATAAAPHLSKMASSDIDEAVRTTAQMTLERHRSALFSINV